MSASPREPFDAEEARAARIYRALPAEEPSPALDARILAQARAAVRSAPRRRRPWFLGAGLGTAAAAVMAAGLAWQMGLIGSAGVAPGASAPASAPATERAAPAADDVERVEIEYYRREARPAPPAAPAGAAAPAPVAARAQAKPAAPPPPPPAAPRDAAPPQEAPAAPEPAAEPVPFPAEADVVEESAAAAAPAAASAQAGEAKRAAGPALERIEVSGSRVRRADVARLPHWTEDSKLPPDAWLERIHERVHAGQRQSAELSLRRFVLMHPNRDVPADLRRLLVE